MMEKSLMVKFEKEDYAVIKKTAENEGRSMANLIRFFTLRGLETKKN